jgi:hypothetical protein
MELKEFRILLFEKASLKSNDKLFEEIYEKLKKEEYEELQIIFVDNKKDLDKEIERFESFADSWDLIILDISDIEEVIKNDNEIQEAILDLFNDMKPKYQILYKQSTNEIFLFEFIKEYNQILVNVFIFKLPFKIYIVSDY